MCFALRCLSGTQFKVRFERQVLCEHCDSRVIRSVNGHNRSSAWCALWSHAESSKQCYRALIDAGAPIDALEIVSGIIPCHYHHASPLPSPSPSPSPSPRFNGSTRGSDTNGS